MREGRAEDHRGAPDSDEERGHTLADSSRAVVRERRRRREGGGGRKGRRRRRRWKSGGRADNGHNTGLTIKTAAGVDFEACFGGGPARRKSLRRGSGRERGVEGGGRGSRGGE